MLLCDSIERFVSPEIEHYIIVSQQDEALFRSSLRPRTQLLLQEKIVPGHFWQFPFLKTWRFSFKTFPIRGWIWQQLVKLSFPHAMESDAIFLLDSDTFFTREFDDQKLMIENKIPLFVEKKSFYETHHDTQKWAAVSRSILKLPPLLRPTPFGYVSCYAFWNRNLVFQLHDHIRKCNGVSNYVPALANHATFSEYSLYGTFIENVIGMENSGHYPLEFDIVHSQWSEDALDKESLKVFKEAMPAHCFLAMINAKSGTPVEQIRATFGF